MSVSRFLCTAGLAAAFFVCPVQAARPAEDYIGTHVQGVDVSPSGTHVAMITANGPDSSVVALGTFQDGTLGAFKGIDLGKFRAVDIVFKNEDRLIVTVVQKGVAITNARDSNDDTYTFDRTLVVSMNLDGASATLLAGEAAFGTTLQSALPNDPAHVLLQVVGNGRFVADIYKADIMTGESELVERGRLIEKNEMGTRLGPQSVRTEGWAVDVNGTPFLRFDVDYAHHQKLVFARAIGSGQWNRFTSFPMIEGKPGIIFAALASPTTVYAFDRNGGDRRALWEYDMASGRPLRQVMADPAAEAVGAQINGFKGELAGVVFMKDGQPKSVYLSKALAAAQAALDASFPQYPIKRIVAYSRNLGVLVVRAEGPSLQPTFLLFDARRMEIAVLGQGQVPPGELGATQTLHYPSSDGRTITAYLTLPPRGGKGLPLVVMPHGGPEVQDTLDYEGWRQFLASRGYAVLQPQFRGSDGFGLAHEAAGHGSWGTAVQDDVRAGVALVEKQGTADASRVCIFGWSYGGYMALAGAAFSPDLYKCAISGAGLSDLGAMMSYEIARTGGKSDVVAYWNARMGGDPGRSQASPVRSAASISIPVLLIHGERDETVPIKQSELMNEALKKAGKPVTFIRLAGEGHSPSFRKEAEMLRQVEAFLAETIGR